MIASGNKSYGIEILLLEEGNTRYLVCELEKVKDAIHINWLKETRTADDIRSLIKKDFPVSVAINGKGALYKSIGDIKNPTIQQFFPGININDFYASVVPYRNTTLGYIIRKRSVDELIEKLSATGINIIGVSFGTGVAIHAFNAIADSIPISKVSIHSSDFTIGEKENPATDLDYTNEITIGDEKLPVNYALAYAAALSYYLDYSDTSVNNEKVANNRAQFKTNTLITRYSLIFLSLILGAILLSTAANYYYSQQVNELSLTVPAYADNTMRDSLIAQINKKKKFLVDGDWLTSSRSSFYADRIAASIPQGMKLTGLNIYPKQNLLAEDEDALAFDGEHLTISGAARDELVLKNWIEGIKSNQWIKSISVSSYQWNSKSNEGEFEVKVKLKE